MYDAYFKDSSYRRYTITSDLVELMKMYRGLGARDRPGLPTISGAGRCMVTIRWRSNPFITRPFRHANDIYNPKMLREVPKPSRPDSAEAMMLPHP